MTVGYVINRNHRTDRLFKFYQQSDSKLFSRIAAVDKDVLSLAVGKHLDFLFNPYYVEQVYSRKITLGEVACTLSHIQCWKTILLNAEIAENEFVLIAEDDVVLCDNFVDKWQQLKFKLQPQLDVDIIILQRLLFRVYDKFHCTKDENLALDIYSSEQPRAFDDCGSSLYAIRKSKAREICSHLLLYKPHWLADNFGQLCAVQNIRLVYPCLGVVVGGLKAESDLEIDRQQSRDQGIK